MWTVSWNNNSIFGRKSFKRQLVFICYWDQRLNQVLIWMNPSQCTSFLKFSENSCWNDHSNILIFITWGPLKSSRTSNSLKVDYGYFIHILKSIRLLCWLMYCVKLQFCIFSGFLSPFLFNDVHIRYRH